jgi:hypothetical protein
MPRVVIGSGVSPSNAWQQYTGGGGPGIFIDVDTSHAQFPEQPVYVCSLHGNSDHWSTIGGSSIYSPTATSFRVYVRRADGSALTPQQAQSNGWHISWIGQFIEPIRIT